MSDNFIEQYTNELNEDEQRQSEAIHRNFNDKYALTEEQIMERVFHGDKSSVQKNMKEVDDLHVKMAPGGGFKLSRYSEERRMEEERNFNELKRQNEELKRQNDELRSDFNELKSLIIEKLKSENV